MPESLSRAGKALASEHMFGRISGFDWLLPRNRSGMHGSTHQLIARVHELNRIVSAAQRELLPALAELDEREAWLDDGAHDMPHWVSMELGVSRWKAERWGAAGHRFLGLPATANPLERGALGIDKVFELPRCAIPDDDEPLAEWAEDVTSGAI